MKRLLIAFTAVCALVCLPLAAGAQIFWEEDFDSYSTGGLIGNGGWFGWDNDFGADALIVDTIVHSPPNSVEILPTTDVVQLFWGATYGQWVITAWCYIPGNSTGLQYWIMMNRYVVGDHLSPDWSQQVVFNSDTGLVQDFNGTGIIPIVRDEWVELKVEIDLDTDVQTVYYDNQMLFTDSWTAHVAQGGLLEIKCLDLFGNNASSIYWDDIIMAGPGAVAVEQTTWGQLKNSYK